MKITFIDGSILELSENSITAICGFRTTMAHTFFTIANLNKLDNMQVFELAILRNVIKEVNYEM